MRYDEQRKERKITTHFALTDEAHNFISHLAVDCRSKISHVLDAMIFILAEDMKESPEVMTRLRGQLRALEERNE